MVLITLSIAFFTFIFWKVFRCIFCKETEKDIGYNKSWYGKEEKPESSAEDASITPFKIHVSDDIINDLKSRLGNLRFEEPLVDSCFNYGFNTNYLSDIALYWKDKYNWRKQEEYLNQFPQFKTKIEGIDVHFIHVKPSLPSDSNVKVLPLLMVHGWPGSVLEFYKMIPLLTTPRNGRVFEIVCPSIPGYGFSESPHRQGFNQRETARFFCTLMERLGHPTFYLQGGDWGSYVTQLIAKYYPSRIRGIHLNMLFVMSKSMCNYIKMMIIAYFPFVVSKAQYSSLFPFKEKVTMLLLETGYMHLQSTKPDTIGCALSNHPIALAAYILEKFSTWTNPNNRDTTDGGLTKKFTLDELLTNVMIYWVNNNITASMRYYKESISDPHRLKHEDIKITVPTGFALFPNEIAGLPKWIAKNYIKDLVLYTEMPRGGHFAAFEEPELLAAEVWKFVEIVEKRAS